MTYPHCSQPVRGPSFSLPKKAPDLPQDNVCSLLKWVLSDTMSAVTQQIMHLVSTNLNQISKWVLRTKSGRQLFDSFSNHTACENTCSHFLIWSKAGWEKTEFEYFLCFVLSPNIHGPRRYIILHSWSENNTSICTAIYRHVCVHIYFVERQYKLYFSQKREHTLFVNLQIFFSLVSGQITSGYLLFFMARKCGQLGHFIRHSPFQTPAETVRDDDFESSGKAVTYQSASNCLW